MKKILVVGYDDTYIQKLSKKINSYIEKGKLCASINCYNNLDLLGFDIQEEEFADIYVFDIDIKPQYFFKKTKELQNTHNNIIIIFLSGNLKLAFWSTKLSVFRFIPKNEVNRIFCSELNEGINYLNSQERNYYTISKKNAFYKISVEDIIYIYREKKYSILVTINGKQRVRKSLKNLFNELQDLRSNLFIPIDKGYIVNIIHIEKLEDRKLYLCQNICLPISRPRLAQVKK